jgi:hypothetical protein
MSERKENKPSVDTLLAFVVTADHCEASILVFANKRSAAKSFARYTPWLCDFDWIDLRCRREPSVDKHSDEFGAGAFECDNEAQQRIMRELGWYEIDMALDECAECGLYEWSSLPESELHHPINGDPLWIYDGPVCTGCKETQQP